MQFRDLLTKNSIYLDTTAQSKTAVLLKMSQLLSANHPELAADTLFDSYWKRECMGSTTIGHGIIIPHIRSADLDKTCACLLKLQNPVDFGASDKQPIDLVIGLVVPQHQTDQHLLTLTHIIQQFSNPRFRSACRASCNREDLFEVVTQGSVFMQHEDAEAVS